MAAHLPKAIKRAINKIKTKAISPSLKEKGLQPLKYLN